MLIAKIERQRCFNGLLLSLSIIHYFLIIKIKVLLEYIVGPRYKKQNEKTIKLLRAKI